MYDDPTPGSPFEGIDISRFNLTGDVVRGTTKTADFLAFDHLNPGFAPLLVQMANEYVETTGKPHGSIQMLIESARWRVDMAVARTGKFEINNDHSAFYSRKLMAENEHLRGLFQPRRADEADDWMIATYGQEIAEAVRPQLKLRGVA